jgi:hypothetical protein
MFRKAFTKQVQTYMMDMHKEELVHKQNQVEVEVDKRDTVPLSSSILETSLLPVEA